MQLVPKRQIGGNLYKIDNTMPQRYVAATMIGGAIGQLL